MAKAPGFIHDNTTGNITMNAGDTGSFFVKCERSSGEAWTVDAWMLYTITDGSGQIVMQRIYRLDDQWDAGDGVVLIEFHNDDTDDWEIGTYQTERRYNVSPIWEGTPSTARCVDALTSSARMVEGVPVRTVFKGTLTIEGVSGRI